MPAKDLRDELDALRRELVQAPAVPDDSEAPAAAATSEARTEIERVLRELHAHLNETVEDAEDIVAEHPLASVGAAFLLGVAVGSLLMRMR